MTTTLSQTVFSPWLTPVRLVSTSNIAGTYYNGPNNNGVGATLTVAASSLTIDSVLCAVGDRVLLHTQTATYQQGIYIVESIGTTVVLQRAEDQQSLEQLKAGEYVAVGAGSVSAGNFYTLVEPLPQAIGVDAVVFNADPSAGGVTFSGPASTANALAVFSDTSGNLKAASTTSTFGQPLNITGALGVTGAITASTSITATGGPITSGSSGDAGSFISFPATAANGTFIFEALNAGGAFNTTVRNSVMGQSSVVSIPDPGSATANFILNTTAGGQSIAGGLTVSTGDFAVSAGTITASGAITSTAGNITSGSSGDAGTFISFPATAANGTLIISALNAGGAFDTTLSNSVMGQSSVLSFPDPGAATANVLLDTGAANILAMQEFVGINDVLTFGTGTWTVTRIAQGNYVSRHTPGDETSVIAIDITPQIRVASSKGFRLDTFDYMYGIAANALDAHSAVLDRIVYANNVAVSVTSVPITATLATATQANPYLTNCTVTTPAFDVTADSKYVLEITVNNAAASEYDFYGIMLRFSQTIA